MTDSPTTSTIKPEVHPGLPGILAGVWSLTWRSRLSVRKLPYLALLLAAFPVLVWFILRFDQPRRLQEAFLEITTYFYLFQVTPLVCLISFGAMMRDEIRHDTIGFFLVRPVSRGRLFAVKHLTLLVWFQAIFLVELLILFCAGALRGVPDLGAVILVLFATQFLAILAWSAVSSFIGLLTKNYIVWGLVIGALIEVGIGRIPTNINHLSLTNNLRAVMARNEVIEDFFNWSNESSGTALWILVLVPVIFTPLSMLIFTLREYLQSTEAQK